MQSTLCDLTACVTFNRLGCLTYIFIELLKEKICKCEYLSVPSLSGSEVLILILHFVFMFLLIKELLCTLIIMLLSVFLISG